jgi:YD repeat-containing protein
MSGIHTQATHFMDCIKTGVDARTGQFTLAFQLPLLPANNLAGPSITPTLTFSVLGSTRDKGFGLGWSLDLSELNLHQDAPSLRLSSGEHFAVDLDSTPFTPGSELTLFDAKLKSRRVVCKSDSVFRVDQKNGQTEILTRQPDSSRYLVTELRSQEGNRVFVEWSPYGNDDFILERISDETRTLLHVQRADDDEVAFTVPGRADETVRLRLVNDALSEVYLPGIDTPFSILYEHHALDPDNHLLLPSTLTSPLGATDSVIWATGEEGHQLPEGAPFRELPRVLQWTHSAGETTGELTRTYQWSGVHNFLGFGSDQAFDWQQGRDNLYQVEQDYDYQVTETQTGPDRRTLATITRTWNRFHLLTSEATRRGNCELRTTTTFGIAPDTDWEDQPAWCQLPHKQTVTYIDHSNADLQRREETEYRYDAAGNVVFTRSPSGIEEHSEYYPADGVADTENGEGCPPNPLGMVRHLKTKTVIPARLDDGTYGGASVISTTYRYASLASKLMGGPAFVVVSRETAWDETQGRLLETTTQTYITDSGPHYARLANKVTTLNGKATATDYRYELSEEELITHVTLTGFERTDRVRATQSSARDLGTGRLTRERNHAGVVSRYAYDALGRVTLAVTADDSRYEARRTSTYCVNDRAALEHRAGSENPVMIEHRHSTGQRRRQWLDGEGRTVRVELEDIDHAPAVFREIASTAFDAEGRSVSETQQDWLRDPQDPAAVTALRLTTTTFYDDWGHVHRSITPDGVETYSEHDPISLTVKRWQQSGTLKSPHTLTHLNAAGSPVSEYLYDTEGTLIRTREWQRDGQDRVTASTIKVPGQADRVTSVQLDVYGRTVEQRLADNTVVSWTYALHSDDNHPETVAVTPPLAAQTS